MEVLKKFAFNSTTSSLNEREMLFEELFNVFDSSQKTEIAEPAFKLLAKLVQYLFPVYLDKKSKLNLISLNNYLIRLNADNSLKAILASLEIHSKALISNEPNESAVHLSLNGIDVLNGLLLSINTHHKDVIDSQKDDFVKLTLIYANFVLSSCFIYGRRKYFNFCYKKIQSLFKKIPGIHVHFVKSIQTDTANVYLLMFCGILLDYLNETKEMSLFNELKSFVLDSYLKNAIAVREKPRVWLVISSNYWLKYATREEFKEKILPSLQRALLRNPEIILQSVQYLFENLIIDLSEFSADLIKTLSSHLMTKDETAQNEAVNAIKCLSKQCSSNEAIYNIMKHLFSVLNAEGKSGTLQQKTSILTSIGNVSHNCSQNIQELLDKLLQLFTDFFKSETNETIILTALQQLNFWFENMKLFSLNGDNVKKLNDFFKTLLENKTSTSSIKYAVFQDMCQIYSIQTDQISNFIAHSNSLIEKALNNPTQNHIISCEALAPSLLLAIHLNGDVSVEPKVQTLINLANDSKKQIFTNEKFLFSLNEQGYKLLCLLIEKFIYINSSKEIFNLNNYYNAFSFGLMYPNFSIRKNAQDVLKKLMKRCSSKEIVSILNSLIQVLESHAQGNFKSSLESVLSTAGEATSQFLNKWPSDKGFSECLMIISNMRDLNGTEIEEISLKFLILANHPLAKRLDPNLYEKCLNRLIEQNSTNLTLNSNELIDQQIDKIFEIATNGSTLSDNQLNIIQALSRIDGKKILKKFLDYSIDLLNSNPDLITITKQEYEIMKLKDGDIFDTSLVDSVLKQSQDSSGTNLKKESKAYSYKDQLAELELRKELDAKKAAQQQKQAESIKSNLLANLDKIKSMMTKKQQETLDQQILRESKIKEDMRQKDQLVNKAVSILKKLIESNKYQIRNHISAIVRVLSKFLRSHLCAPYVFDVFDLIASKVYSVNTHSKYGSINFNRSIVNCTFRLANSPLNFDSSWTQESLEQASTRLLEKVNQETDIELERDEFDLSKSSFFYLFFKNVTYHLSSCLNENALKHLLESVLKFSKYRNKVEKKVLNDLKNGHHDRLDSIDLLDQLNKNFMSSEYTFLLIDIIQLSCDKKFNIHYLASNSIKEIFDFYVKFLLSIDLVESNKELKQSILSNYNNEISELIRGLVSAEFDVRETCLNCFVNLIDNMQTKNKRFYLDNDIYENFTHKLIVSCFDVEESNRKLAEKLWKEGEFKTSDELCILVCDDIVHPYENFRLAASEALAHMVKNGHSSVAKNLMQNLIAKYDELNKVIEPKPDQYGRISADDQTIDYWELRTGIAFGLGHLAESIPSDDETILELFQFFVQKSLNDRNMIVKNKMLDSAIQCLNYHGKSKINVLLPLFEDFLENAPKVASFDSVRQNVCILMGTLAKHLDKDDPKVEPIIGKLIQSLQTPSQQVQEAVANCLPPLMSSIKTQVPNFVNQLLNLLFSAKTYGERRGAAYGLAGMLKGVGMLSLRQLSVLQRLNEAVNNKDDPKQREGALLAYEMLTIIFGKVFEPYSVEILPNLLISFGDADANVRQAADDCAKAIMANLTFTGVKMILPKLLERLGEEESWRTKCGSVELLGAMAHCAPKQLSTCLPNIVPKLIEILSDSHIKVQKAGTQALRQIGSVIKNPEILSISGTLLEALQDPALKTQKALQVLLETKFVHFIDAPSLALIMPVVQRAFQDRSTEIRKMAAQIMGNMYSLTDQKDLLPYLPAILPGLKQSLLDPVPEVRSVSSKALGAMIRAIGENGLNDIISWLMEKLVSETSSVDRSGAAQGLSEVFGALGVAKLEKSIPEIIERAVQVDLSPYVRDGYMMMFIYLPLTFGEDFTPYVGYIIQPILKALADDSEFVRDTAIKAGQRIVNTYADTAISLFLPELEKGLFDNNWRIRFSSVQLLGDLLYKISGVAGKMTTESAHEDDNFGTEKGSAAIITALGEERRNIVYSGLYMGRSDVSSQVRQAALHVWKVIVSNTPRTLKEILPTLFNLLLGCLASNNHDKRQIAATTLSDIVRKLGERVLPEIIPILEHGLNSERSEQRQGVCIGLTEIMANTSRDNIINFSDSLVPTVRKALIDHLSEVRQSAAKTFDNLHNNIGVKAMDEVALYLFEEMKKNEKSNKELSERALDGLKQIMIVKSRALLPFLIPYLTQPPVNIHALCKLCCSASIEVLSKHLNRILNTLIQAFSSLDVNNENAYWINECQSLLLAIHDPDGIKTIITELLNHSTSSSENETIRSSALEMLVWFCSKTKADISNHVDELVKSLLCLFAEKNENILVKAWTCLNSVIEPLKGNSLVQRLPTIRQSIRVLTNNTSYLNNKLYDAFDITDTKSFLPGFCLPKKGISCLLPIFKEGLLNGAPDIKEQSASTLCECIKLSDGDSLKSCVMAITGPLIRVLGERYSWMVKSAILDAIYLLLLKVDITLRPFLPQLQPTFLKNLNDVNRIVRLKSGCALSKLLFMNPKLDQIVLEINNYLKNNDELEIKETQINTLRLCINNVGAKLQVDTKTQVFNTLYTEAYVYHQENAIRSVSCGAVGSLAPYLTDKELETLVGDIFDYDKNIGKNLKYLQSNCMILSMVLKYSPARLLSKVDEAKCASFLITCANNDRTPICLSALRCVCYFIEYKITNNLKIEQEVTSILAKGINNTTTEVKQFAIEAVIYLHLKNPNPKFDQTLLKAFIPMIVNGTRERAPSVRNTSELALAKVLKLNESNTILNECLEILSSMKDSINDCVKSLSKENINRSINIHDYQIDETSVKIDP